ncbi:MAG: RDD family protein [Anaeromyxobacter sp.]
MRPLEANLSLDRRAGVRGSAAAPPSGPELDLAGERVARAPPPRPGTQAPLTRPAAPVAPNTARAAPVEGRATPAAPTSAPRPPALAAAAPAPRPSPPIVAAPPAPRPPPPAPLLEEPPLEEPASLEDDTIEVAVEPVEVHLHRASDWRRVLAWAIDGPPFVALFLWGTQVVLQRLAPSRDLAAWGYVEAAAAHWGSLVAPILGAVAVLWLVYATLCHALAGATLGKGLLRVRVVGPGGRRPSLGRSAFRSALALMSVALLGLGVLLALFTRSGRGLHDLIARTWVVEASP